MKEKWKTALLSFFEKYPFSRFSFLRRICFDRRLRALLSLFFGGLFNTAYAFFHIITAVRYGSESLLMLSLYYLMLSANRLFLIRAYRLSQKAEKGNVQYPWRVYRHAGAFLLALGLSMTGVVAITASEKESYPYSPAVFFVTFLYTTALLILALRASIHLRRSGSPILSAAKTVSLAGAFVSVFSLYSTAAARFQGVRTYLSIAVGGGSVLFILALSVFMMIHGKRQINNQTLA